VAQVNDLSRSLTAFDPISTLVVVVEMSKASWLVSGVVPGIERQPLKKLESDATALLRLIERWRNEAMRSGRPISQITLAYEAGRDGFWLARWLAGSRRMSSIRQALRCHASASGRRRIVWMRRC
jgi:transposase